MENEANFEEPLELLRQKIEELEGYPPGAGHDRELERLRRQLRKDTEAVFKRLDRWQTTLLARHAKRPYTLDYVAGLIEEWVELHGDRRFADDHAVVCGLGRFNGRPIAVVGHQKGRGTRERIDRNFGQPRPEGYRKALRVMELANKFSLPIIAFIDTPGAYPGIGAEERGQAEAIARNLIEMAAFTVPIVAVVTGEGGSGGALALGVGNRVLMLEHSVYSVITPEGCAAILWKDQEQRAAAAEAMRVTARDLDSLGIVDEVIPEPLGGAHTDADETVRRVGEAIERHLAELETLSASELVEDRHRRFASIGAFVES